MLKLFTLALVLTSGALAYQGYDNERGAKITNCIRKLLKSTPALPPAELEKRLDRTRWRCNEVHYLWDDNKDLAIFSHNKGDQYGAIFGFKMKKDHRGTNLVESITHKDRYMVSFAHEFQHGIVTMSETGLSPHIDYYFVLTPSGHLVYEKFTHAWQSSTNPMTNYWPAIKKHPRAVYGDWPTRPDNWIDYVLSYGICQREDLDFENDACY